MMFFKSFFMRNWYYFVIGFLTLSLAFISYFYYEEVSAEELSNDEVVTISAEPVIEEESSSDVCIIDIKGAVKKPNVYEVDCNITINEAIKLAGGVKKDASTNNINLAKKVTNEMVIYVYTKKELNKTDDTAKSNTIVNCKSNEVYIDQTKDESNITQTQEEVQNNLDNTINNDTEAKLDLVNINGATKEELMTITGIGESKAISIIEYRENNGCFQSIEEIKNVSGIGDALFEKIKNYITV